MTKVDKIVKMSHYSGMKKTRKITIWYLCHFLANVKVSLWSLIYFVSHLFHAFIPIRYTSHEWFEEKFDKSQSLSKYFMLTNKIKQKIFLLKKPCTKKGCNNVFHLGYKYTYVHWRNMFMTCATDYYYCKEHTESEIEIDIKLIKKAWAK